MLQGARAGAAGGLSRAAARDMAAVLDLSEAPSNGVVKLIAEDEDVVLEWGALRVRFPRVGQTIGYCRL